MFTIITIFTITKTATTTQCLGSAAQNAVLIIKLVGGGVHPPALRVEGGRAAMESWNDGAEDSTMVRLKRAAWTFVRTVASLEAAQEGVRDLATGRGQG
ncbi:hypothetical protein IFM46972_10722 [Aspergillus udagawae]|uniref:Uncharacterized protein n=1 Tax=Aspergillus udagawae TaxID=91492 RepID=A0A8H3SDY6_9EURO|nr:hypothetical protein IFM46972_10722 [Aspergillus udagawae]